MHVCYFAFGHTVNFTFGTFGGFQGIVCMEGREVEEKEGGKG